jgi:hypothetical protein
MQRIYLDFKDWVDMARAAAGRPRQPEHADVIEIARYGVNAGLVEFPLSSVSYMELLQHRTTDRREQVGRVMVELSRLTTMASGPLLLPEELDRALRSRFGRPHTLRQHPVFGHGIGHAFGVEEYEFPLPSELQLDEVTRVRLERQLSEVVERAMLAGPARAFGIEEAPPGTDDARRRAEDMAKGEAAVGAHIRSGGYRGARLKEVWTARALIEIVDELTRAEIRAGVHPKELTMLGKAGMTEFLLDLPVYATFSEMKYLIHADPGRTWDGNTVRDIPSLACAVVHCDVVVTERNWKALLERTKRPAKYGTVVESNISGLRTALVRAA